MTVKDIVEECFVKIGRRDLVGKPQLDGQDKELEDDLVAATNSAYGEVSESFPEVVTEDVNIIDGELKYSALKDPLLYPIKLEAAQETVKFKAYPSRLVALMSGRAKLTYAVAFMKKLTVDSELPTTKCTKGILSDGALARYYFAHKSFDLASAFDADFRYGLEKLRSKGRTLMLKETGWFI